MSRLTWDGTTEPVSRDQILRREQGQEIIDFPCIDSVSAGIFEGSQFKEADVTPIELPNHAPISHNEWVKTEIKSPVQKGSLAACVCVCVCYIKLHITTQSGPVILVILCHSH